MYRIFLYLLVSHLLCSSLLAQSIERQHTDPISNKVENMYVRGLQYLAKTQQTDGSWSDRSGSEVGVVGLAALAFLAHGEDPTHGPYAKHVQNAISFILKNQDSKSGYIGQSMYNHGFATLALAEAYGILNDPQIEKSLKKAVELILSAQKVNMLGGWRYSPTAKDADSSISGCQIVALLAARNAGIPIPNKSIKKALKYMSSCRNSNGSYGYTSHGRGKVTLTAVGSLCFALAKQKTAKGYDKSLKHLIENIEHRDTHYTYYFEYYMSQALFQADEKTWQAWNTQNIRLMSATQQPDGSWNGSFGSSYSTASALLSLALNYRLLPIYEK